MSATVASGNPHFPVLVTVPSSSRHELLMIQPYWSFNQLGKKICDAVTTSPNCSGSIGDRSEVTHLSGGPAIPPGKIKVLRVRWSRDLERDAPGWPRETIITRDNHSSVLCMLWERISGGRADILEAEFANWELEEGIQPGGETLPAYHEVERDDLV